LLEYTPSNINTCFYKQTGFATDCQVQAELTVLSTVSNVFNCMGGVRGCTLEGLIQGLIPEFIGIGALKFREVLEIWNTILQRGGSGALPREIFKI
jgi:hypothetical protein